MLTLHTVLQATLQKPLYVNKPPSCYCLNLLTALHKTAKLYLARKDYLKTLVY